MKMILSGGGGFTKNPPAYQMFADAVDKRKPVLYICFASLPEAYNDGYGKFTFRMAELGIYSTRLCDSPKVFDEFDLSMFGGIYCAGGNTYRLLKTLRDCGAIEKITAYLKNGGVYIGTSAGAIIAGADINPITYMDSNAVVLKDTRGFNLIGGYSTIAHYGDSASEQCNAERAAAVKALSLDYDKLIALSEESAIVIDDDRTYILGADCLVYDNGKERIVESGKNLF